MSEHDPLERFANSAGNDIAVPDFERLLATSRRRRRLSTLGAGALAAVAVGAVSWGWHVIDTSAGPRLDPVGPVHSAPPVSGVASAAVVDDLAARPVSVAVLPDQPSDRAVVWRSADRGAAVAVTSDGFRSRTTMTVHGGYVPVTAVGAAWFFVADRKAPALLTPDGVLRQVTIGGAAPLADGEYLAQGASGATLAVDPEHATAHPLTVPDGVRELYGDRGLLWSIPCHAAQEAVVHCTVVWSGDGGDTWSSHSLPSGELAVYTPVQTTDGSMVASLTGDVTVTQLRQTVTSRDGGRSWQTSATRPARPIGWALVLPDGRLLIDALDDRSGGGDDTLGLLVSNGSDWSRLQPLHPQIPPGASAGADDPGELKAIATDGGAVVIYTVTASRQLLASDDGGQKWTLVADR